MELKQHSRKREKEREQEQEARSLDERRRTNSTKYDIRFTMRALESIYSDHRADI